MGQYTDEQFRRCAESGALVPLSRTDAIAAAVQAERERGAKMCNAMADEFAAMGDNGATLRDSAAAEACRQCRDAIRETPQ